MMKFFRKYNKHLLAVFASLLLVVWLGSQALENLFRPDPTSAAFAKAYGRELTHGEVNAAQAETQILSQVGIPWSKPWARDLQTLRFDFYEPLTEVEWLLLKLDAHQRGVTVTRSQTDAFKQSLGLTERRLEQIGNRLRVSTNAIEAAIDDFLLIRAVYELIQSGIRVTDPETRQLAKMQRETVEVRMIGVPAEIFVDAQAMVPEDEIAEQYEKYQDQLPGREGLGFGYKYGDRVNVEYIVADVEAVASTVVISKAEAKEYWQQTKQTYLKPLEELATQPADTQPAGTQPASQPFEQVPYYETFMEARDQVIQRLQRQRAGAEAQRLMNELLASHIIPLWEGAETDKGGFPRAPAAAKAPQFTEDAVASFVARQPAYQDVFSVHQTGLVERDDLADVPGFGRAFAQTSDRRNPAARPADLAFNVQGLVEPPAEELARASARPLALYEFSPIVLKGSAGSAYAFRVIDSRKSAPPESLSDIRQKVIWDVRIARAYEEAKTAAQELLAAAQAENLDAAWTSAEELRQRIEDNKLSTESTVAAWGLKQPAAFARQTGTGDPTPVLGLQSKALIDACFTAAEAMEPDAAKKPVLMIELPEHRMAVVAETLQLNPIYEEDYLAMRPSLQYPLGGQRLRLVIENWFNPEKIRARADFEQVR